MNKKIMKIMLLVSLIVLILFGLNKGLNAWVIFDFIGLITGNNAVVAKILATVVGISALVATSLAVKLIKEL